MGHTSDERTVGVLKRYAAGEISAREAAWQMGPGATEHDVYVGTLRAGLSVPSPPEDVIAAEVAALRGLLGMRGNRHARALRAMVAQGEASGEPMPYDMAAIQAELDRKG